MRAALLGLVVAGAMLTPFAASFSAEDASDEAVKQDRLRIEGTWTIIALEINGNKAGESDAKKLSVVNGSDGAWTLFSEGKEVSRGTSSIDPKKTPKTIDFTATDGGGSGEQFHGIYELGEKTRKLCFAPLRKERPIAFATTPQSEQILVVFERDKSR